MLFAHSGCDMRRAHGPLYHSPLPPSSNASAHFTTNSGHQPSPTNSIPTDVIPRYQLSCPSSALSFSRTHRYRFFRVPSYVCSLLHYLFFFCSFLFSKSFFSFLHRKFVSYIYSNYYTKHYLIIPLFCSWSLPRPSFCSLVLTLYIPWSAIHFIHSYDECTARLSPSQIYSVYLLSLAASSITSNN